MFNLQSDSNFIALNERFQCELIVQDNEPELLLLKVLKFVASSYTSKSNSFMLFPKKQLQTLPDKHRPLRRLVRSKAHPFLCASA